MQKSFQELHPIDLSKATNQPFIHYPPVFPGWLEPRITYSNWPAPGYEIELEFTGWRDEGIAKHDTCSVCNFLTPPLPVLIIRGPEAMKFFSEHLVNSFAKFSINTGKHAIMCNEDGNMIMQGILYRLGEEEFEAHCLMTLPYIIETCGKKYDMTVEDQTGNRFLLQTSGLNSLALIEELTGENLHDLKFCHMRHCTIDGMPVRIYRFGMTGSIGYEITGEIAYADQVYRKLLEVGNKYGIRRMGGRSYTMNHTPGGFLQYGMHYLNAIMDDPGYKEAMEKENGVSGLAMPIDGSYDGPYQNIFANPIEYGCANVVKFDHDFPGRAALEKIAANPQKKMVTLEWNPDDLADIYRSQFDDGESYQPMDYPIDNFRMGAMCVNCDKVLDENGNMIGISTHRTHDAYFKKMLSLCAINIAYSEIGTDVSIVWGRPGTRQKIVRAKVERFPYNNHLPNRTFDTSQVPHPAK